MYAVYHGPEGLKTIANRVHGLAAVFSAGVSKLGLQTGSAPFFDTVKVTVGEGQAERITKDATAHGVNLRVFDSDSVSFYIPVAAAVYGLNFWRAICVDVREHRGSVLFYSSDCCPQSLGGHTLL